MKLKGMGDYKKVIKEILGLTWDSLDEEDLQRLMILSAYSALEFADSLRLTLKLNPSNSALKEVVGGELQTKNLTFRDYNKMGDHSQFLWYFIKKYNLMQKFSNLRKVGEEYVKRVKSLPDEVRIMSIVSRENELPGIFTRIIGAKKWKGKGLPEYKYYLMRHISLDSCKGGHADLLSNFKVDNRVAEFYKIRLEMYKSIPKLFSKTK